MKCVCLTHRWKRWMNSTRSRVTAWTEALINPKLIFQGTHFFFPVFVCQQRHRENMSPVEAGKERRSLWVRETTDIYKEPGYLCDCFIFVPGGGNLYCKMYGGNKYHMGIYMTLKVTDILSFAKCLISSFDWLFYKIALGYSFPLLLPHFRFIERTANYLVFLLFLLPCVWSSASSANYWSVFLKRLFLSLNFLSFSDIHSCGLSCRLIIIHVRNDWRGR